MQIISEIVYQFGLYSNTGFGNIMLSICHHFLNLIQFGTSFDLFSKCHLECWNFASVYIFRNETNKQPYVLVLL